MQVVKFSIEIYNILIDKMLFLNYFFNIKINFTNYFSLYKPASSDHFFLKLYLFYKIQKSK